MSLCFRLIAVLCLMAVSGCATLPPATDPDAMADFTANNDRLEPFNRSMFAVDRVVDAALVRPIAWTYRKVIPEPARDGVSNVLRNIHGPIVLVNDVLQGNMERAGVTLERFAVNSTVGVLGLFDVATRIGLPYHGEDFGQTLASWGVGEGSFLYVPVFGPMTLRDGPGYLVDAFVFDPVAWYTYNPHTPGWVQWAYLGTEILDGKARTMSVTDELKKSSLDYYATLRSAWRQNRALELRNGAAEPTPELQGPDPFADPFAEPAATP